MLNKLFVWELDEEDIAFVVCDTSDKAREILINNRPTIIHDEGFKLDPKVYELYKLEEMPNHLLLKIGEVMMTNQYSTVKATENRN